ncbi:tripartite tricarboxylate transporter substrate binding protein [Roseococcus sp. SYP-B2431]|uniref:Bug family tripartite tricarboxylate transporter substrate binding protein n=1 Tax=Roseococcus sp. SYP-B2431 TaxID=2496640 RepID=UPI00103F2716|nr:tripartite tricarboxylate transporter substrate-binding protein [Roseococcus sp. SYP-B2431]TCI00359.1 tripartite tricarboxylate transporter substrate binding protein [Roseococcus sp. SYP-B2431]
MSRRSFIAGLLSAPVALSRPSWAQSFPSRPIRLLVPVPAGSVPDVIARLLAQRLAEQWPVPVVVENRPGAGGAIGVEAAIRAPADGHVLLLGSSGPIAILPAVNRRLSYDPLRDLVPVARCADFPLIFLASVSSGLRSFEDLLDRARSSGEMLDYAGGDLGSTQHLSGALLVRQAGIRLNHVPYRGGGLAQADLIAGRLPVMVDSLTAVLRTIQDGKAIPLAVCGAQRASQLPHVPTVAESVPGYESTGWMGVFAPAAVPWQIVARVSALCTGLIGDPALAARIVAAGSDPMPQPASEFRAFVAAELVKWAQLAGSAGIAIE